MEYGAFPRVPAGLFCCGRAYEHPPAQLVPTSTLSVTPRPMSNVDPADLAWSFTRPLIQSVYEDPAPRPLLTRQDALQSPEPDVQIVPLSDSESESSSRGSNCPNSLRPSTSRAPFW